MVECKVYIIKHIFLVDGGWSNWNEWDKCSLPCGGGIRTRNRSCNTPVPQHGGELCDGNDTEHLQCNNQNCPGKCVRLLITHV